MGIVFGSTNLRADKRFFALRKEAAANQGENENKPETKHQPNCNIGYVPVTSPHICVLPSSLSLTETKGLELFKISDVL